MDLEEETKLISVEDKIRYWNIYTNERKVRHCKGTSEEIGERWCAVENEPRRSEWIEKQWSNGEKEKENWRKWCDKKIICNRLTGWEKHGWKETNLKERI